MGLSRLQDVIAADHDAFRRELQGKPLWEVDIAKALNCNSIEEVRDLESLIQRLQENELTTLEHDTWASQAPSLASYLNRDALQEIDTYTFDQCMVDLDQRLRNLLHIADDCDLTDLHRLHREVEDLKFQTGKYRKPLNTMLSKVVGCINLMIKNCEDTKTSFIESGRILLPLFTVLVDIISRPTVDTLGSSEIEVIHNANEEYIKAAEAKKEAFEDGNMAVFEAASEVIIRTNEEMLRRTLALVSLCDDDATWAKKQANVMFRQNSCCDATLATVAATNASQLEVVRGELATLQRRMSECEEEERARRESEAERWSQTSTAIDAAAAAMREKWAALRVLYRDVMALGGEREALLQQHCERLSESLARQMAIRKRREFYGARKRQLVLNVRTHEAYQRVYELMGSVNKLCRDGVAYALLENGQHDYKAERREKCVACFEYFRRLYIETGELLYRRRQIVKQHESESEECRMKYELCVDIMDPVAKGIKEECRRLESLLIAERASAESLSERAQANLNRIAPVEEFLLNSGWNPGTHPTVHVNEMNLLRQEQSLKFREKLHRARRLDGQREAREAAAEAAEVERVVRFRGGGVEGWKERGKPWDGEENEKGKGEEGRGVLPSIGRAASKAWDGPNAESPSKPTRL